MIHPTVIKCRPSVLASCWGEDSKPRAVHTPALRELAVLFRISWNLRVYSICRHDYCISLFFCFTFHSCDAFLSCICSWHLWIHTLRSHQGGFPICPPPVGLDCCSPAHKIWSVSGPLLATVCPDPHRSSLLFRSWLKANSSDRPAIPPHPESLSSPPTRPMLYQVSLFCFLHTGSIWI